MRKGFPRDTETVALGKKKNLHLTKHKISPNIFCQKSSDIVSNIKPCKIRITDSYKHHCWFIFNETSDSYPGACFNFQVFTHTHPAPQHTLAANKMKLYQTPLFLKIKKNK